MEWQNLREEEFENAVKISGGVCVVQKERGGVSALEGSGLVYTENPGL